MRCSFFKSDFITLPLPPLFILENQSEEFVFQQMRFCTLLHKLHKCFGDLYSIRDSVCNSLPSESVATLNALARVYAQVVELSMQVLECYHQNLKRTDSMDVKSNEVKTVVVEGLCFLSKIRYLLNTNQGRSSSSKGRSKNQEKNTYGSSMILVLGEQLDTAEPLDVLLQACRVISENFGLRDESIVGKHKLLKCLAVVAYSIGSVKYEKGDMDNVEIYIETSCRHWIEWATHAKSLDKYESSSPSQNVWSVSRLDTRFSFLSTCMYAKGKWNDALLALAKAIFYSPMIEQECPHHLVRKYVHMVYDIEKKMTDKTVERLSSELAASVTPNCLIALKDFNGNLSPKASLRIMNYELEVHTEHLLKNTEELYHLIEGCERQQDTEESALKQSSLRSKLIEIAVSVESSLAIMGHMNDCIVEKGGSNMKRSATVLSGRASSELDGIVLETELNYIVCLSSLARYFAHAQLAIHYTFHTLESVRFSRKLENRSKMLMEHVFDSIKKLLKILVTHALPVSESVAPEFSLSQQQIKMYFRTCLEDDYKAPLSLFLIDVSHDLLAALAVHLKGIVPSFRTSKESIAEDANDKAQRCHRKSAPTGGSELEIPYGEDFLKAHQSVGVFILYSLAYACSMQVVLSVERFRMVERLNTNNDIWKGIAEGSASCQNAHESEKSAHETEFTQEFSGTLDACKMFHEKTSLSKTLLETCLACIELHASTRTCGDFTIDKHIVHARVLPLLKALDSVWQLAFVEDDVTMEVRILLAMSFLSGQFDMQLQAFRKKIRNGNKVCGNLPNTDYMAIFLLAQSCYRPHAQLLYDQLSDTNKEKGVVDQSENVLKSLAVCALADGAEEYGKYLDVERATSSVHEDKQSHWSSTDTVSEPWFQKTLCMSASADAYMKRLDIDTALKYARSSYKIAAHAVQTTQEGFGRWVALKVCTKNLIQISRCWDASGNGVNAKGFLQKALKLTARAPFLSTILMLNRLLAEVMCKRENTDEARQYVDQAQAIDSISKCTSDRHVGFMFDVRRYESAMLHVTRGDLCLAASLPEKSVSCYNDAIDDVTDEGMDFAKMLYPWIRARCSRGSSPVVPSFSKASCSLQNQMCGVAYSRKGRALSMHPHLGDAYACFQHASRRLSQCSEYHHLSWSLYYEALACLQQQSSTSKVEGLECSAIGRAKKLFLESLGYCVAASKISSNGMNVDDERAEVHCPRLRRKLCRHLSLMVTSVEHSLLKSALLFESIGNTVDSTITQVSTRSPDNEGNDSIDNVVGDFMLGIDMGVGNTKAYSDAVGVREWFAQLMRQHLQIIQILPEDWTACALCTVECCSTRYLTISRIHVNSSMPTVLQIPIDKGSMEAMDMVGQILDASQKILKPSSETTDWCSTQKKDWWDQRYKMDEDLGKSLACLEREWLGPWRGLLVGRLASPSRERALRLVATHVEDNMRQHALGVADHSRSKGSSKSRKRALSSSSCFPGCQDYLYLLLIGAAEGLFPFEFSVRIFGSNFLLFALLVPCLHACSVSCFWGFDVRTISIRQCYGYRRCIGLDIRAPANDFEFASYFWTQQYYFK
jgi:tetratricopeptide (TPR) repeat protein